MTYGVEKLTFHGNTLYEKLRAQYGERAARSVNLGLEANAKKEAMRRAGRAEDKRTAQSSRAADSRAVPSGKTRTFPATRPANTMSRPLPNNDKTRRFPLANAQSPQSRIAGQSRPIPQGRSIPQSRDDLQSARRPMSAAQGAQRPKNGAHSRPAKRAHAHDRVLTEPRPSRIATAQEAYAHRNPFRARINYMRRPVTGKSDLEISIATFPEAYKAGMRAKRAIGAGLAHRHGGAHAGEVIRGYRPGDIGSTGSSLDNSRRVMAEAYRYGERMRRVTQIENARPTSPNAKGIEVPKGFAKFRARARAVFIGKGRHAVEVKVKRSPFPIGTVALILVCMIVMMVMISSFAEMSDYRRGISDLETKYSSLELERARLSGLVENREDIRVIEKIAIEDIGMVSADLAQGRFVSLADYDSVEIIKNDGEDQKPGVFASIFSAISENLGSVSDYIN